MDLTDIFSYFSNPDSTSIRKKNDDYQEVRQEENVKDEKNVEGENDDVLVKNLTDKTILISFSGEEIKLLSDKSLTVSPAAKIKEDNIRVGKIEYPFFSNNLYIPKKEH